MTLLVSVVSHPAPEHFGDTILFTTDEDILEAIFCSDETFDVDPESPYSLQSEETPRRPSTAGSEGEDRPYTQAGPWAEDRVGLAGRGAPPREISPPDSACSGRNEDGSPLSCWCYCFDISHFSTSFFGPLCHISFSNYVLFFYFFF